MTHIPRRSFLAVSSTGLAVFPFSAGSISNGPDEDSTSTDTESTTHATSDQENAGKNNDDERATCRKDLDIGINVPDTVFEGEQVPVTVTITNPGREERIVDLHVHRDDWDTLYEDTVLVEAGDEFTEMVTWYVRNDAAGHTMEIVAEAGSAVESERVSGTSRFRPTIEDVTIDGAGKESVLVEYLVENTGSAPASHDVELLVDGEVVHEETLHIGIGDDKINEHTVEVPSDGSDEHTIEVRTTGQTVTETVE